MISIQQTNEFSHCSSACWPLSGLCLPSVQSPAQEFVAPALLRYSMNSLNILKNNLQKFREYICYLGCVADASIDFANVGSILR